MSITNIVFLNLVIVAFGVFAAALSYAAWKTRTLLHPKAHQIASAGRQELNMAKSTLGPATRKAA